MEQIQSRPVSPLSSAATTTRTTATTIQPKDELVVESDPHKARFLELKTWLESEIKGDFTIAVEVCAALQPNDLDLDLPIALKPLLDSKETRLDAFHVASFILGEMYRDGLSYQINSCKSEDDDNVAAGFFLVAASENFGFAKEALHEMYLAGRGLETDKGFVGSRRCGDESDPHGLAMLLLPIHCKGGDATEYLKNEAFPKQTESHQKDPNPIATYQLSVLYEEKGDYQAAWNFLQLAAGLDNPDALCRLGELYLEPEKHPLALNCYSKSIDNYHAQQKRAKITGVESAQPAGITKNEKTAEKYFKQAMEAGSKRGSDLLEKMYFEGRGVGALAYFEGGSKDKNPSAIYGLGVLYEKGVAVNKDEKKAFELFTQAANAGSPDALCRIAESFLTGNETLQNFAGGSPAKSYLVKAANLGHAKASFMLGINCLTQGPNRHDAEKYFRIAHDQGYPGAAFQLGLMNLQGSATGANVIDAIKFLKQAAFAGDLDACCQLGELCLVDIGTPLISQNFLNAKSWFAAAASQGHAKAAYLLTRFYPLKADVDEQWYFPFEQTVSSEDKQRAAETIRHIRGVNQWDPRDRIATELDVEEHFYRRNGQELYRLLQIAAKGDIPEASFRLGCLLFNLDEDDNRGPYSHINSGLNEAERLKMIEGCFRKAADQGHGKAAKALYESYEKLQWSSALTPPFIDYPADAEKYYGIALKDGCRVYGQPNVPKPGKYAKLLEAAAKSGLPDAQYRLGELYRIGDKSLNISQDLKLAEKYLRQAVEKGHPKAAYSVGQMTESRPFSLSDPFANNEANAISLYEIARDGGVAEAALRLGQIYEAHIADVFSFGESSTLKAIENYKIAAKSDNEQTKTAALSALKKLRPPMHHSSASKINPHLDSQAATMKDH